VSPTPARRAERAVRRGRQRIAQGDRSGSVGILTEGGASRLGAWRLAARPATLPAALAPVLVGLGVALGQGVFRPIPAFGCVAVALLLQVAANLANDLFDFRSGADNTDRLGPPRAAATGLLTQRDLVVGIVVVLGLAGLAGLSLVAVGGPVILVLGLLAVASALAYTGGPWPYGYHGLGEIFVFAFFGLVAVAGTAFLQTGAWQPLAFAAAIPIGAIVTGILVVNNLRDLATDRAAGKHTLATRIGAGPTEAEYLLLLVAAYATPIGILLAGVGSVGVLLPIASLPLVVPLVRTIRAGGDPRRLNAVLRGTARLALAFALLFALGLTLGVRAG
jgi:1,4-dihydroxy-2-naphthoate polyprenyltransferase